MADTVQILDAINNGFKGLHNKIDNYDDRIVSLETERAVKKALCEKQKENKKFWTVVIRSVSISGIGSLLYLIWVKIKAVLDLVP